MLSNILNLPDHKVARIEETDHDYHNGADIPTLIRLLEEGSL